MKGLFDSQYDVTVTMRKSSRTRVKMTAMILVAAVMIITITATTEVGYAESVATTIQTTQQQAPFITLVQSSDDRNSERYAGFVSMEKKVYSWTDKVHITIVAPDYNFDNKKRDTIGSTEPNTVKIHTRESILKQYKLVETGENTGIFKGDVILIGFDHDADGDGQTGSRPGGYDNPQREPGGSGPSGGYLAVGRDDAITVSFQYTEDHTIVKTVPVMWSVGHIEWASASHAASGTSMIRVVDPDMNWNPESLDRFEVNVRSDSDPVGISLAVIETASSSGIFEGAVTFTDSDRSSGHRLRVAEGDIVTAEYDDNTLPSPHNTSDNLELVARSHIGVLTDPLERVRISNVMIADGIGYDLGDEVSAGQQVQISSTLSNNQEGRGQPFVCIVVISEVNSDTVTSLSWIKGHLQSGQQLNAATSWLPEDPGTYEITVFVWESITQPDALAPPFTMTLAVN